MFQIIHRRMQYIPAPLAGLALGFASICWSLENTFALHGYSQSFGAIVAAGLLSLLAYKFCLHPRALLNDLLHPVIGSVVPTFAMALMVISKSLEKLSPHAGAALWLLAVIIHLSFLAVFVIVRVRVLKIHHFVPSWFVPPVGIIVADVAAPSHYFSHLSLVLLWFGLISYAFLLPVMFYRFIFCTQVSDAAKPTIAILAAPASLSLAGYLTVVRQPSLLMCALLMGIAILMTAIIYLAFFHLLRLPFSPGYSAFTFPMAIGATALYKLSALVASFPGGLVYSQQLHFLANVEVVIGSVVIAYVCWRYLGWSWQLWTEHQSQRSSQCVERQQPQDYLA
ncbi:TDT family transporter [Celerinatantimonas yamalensis]|uniref:TDT family transporter n=1 Tax=Celerinatantimonas yamalensis TaxID=559956 RepID=A0ABW9G8Z6_9GAMM